MNKKLKKGISKGMFGGAVGLLPVAAWIGLSDMQSSDLFMYTVVGTFWVCMVLHALFRDENFDKVEAINNAIWVLLPWCVILFIYAFAFEAYVAMFVSLGFFILIYLIHLLMGVIDLKEEHAGGPYE